jgi:hypothetical protein
MRPLLLGLVCCAVSVGCAQPQFPSPEQNAAAIKAVENDKSERIKPAVLQGMWVGDKGSVLTFGPSHNITYRAGAEGNSKKGEYVLEGTKLFLEKDSIGWISMTKNDQFILAQTREHLEHFRKVA